MRRGKSVFSLSVLAAVCSLAFSPLSADHKPNHSKGGDGGGGSDEGLTNPAYVVMDGDNISRLKLLSFDGLQEQEIVRAKAFRGMKAPTWSPDGRWIAYTKGENSGNSLRIIRPDGRDEQVLFHFTGVSGEPPVIDPSHGMQWVPGEVDRIIYVSGSGQVFVISSLGENPEPEFVLPGWFGINGITLSPDFELETPGYQGAAAFVKDGLLKVAAAADDGLGLQIDTTSLVTATSLNDGVATPAWSHNGFEIAFLYHEPGFGNSLEVLPVLVDSSGITLFEDSVRTIYDSSLVDTYGPYHQVVHRPSWSPDDSLISFCAQVGGEPSGSKAFDLFVAESNGLNYTNITDGTKRPIFVDWSPTWEVSME